MSKKPKVGQEVKALCSRCKDETVHIVEVIKNDKIVKAMCKSCHASHKYRVTAAKKSKTPEERKWSRIMAKTDADTPIEYKMDRSYAELSVIEHHTFGIGVVKEILAPTKISVVFQDGMRTLVQNR
jgi:ribosomal protein L44E